MQKRLAPRGDTGALERSIGSTFGDYRPANANVRGFGGAVSGDPDLTVTVHAGDAVAWYASLVEFGTKNRTVKNYFGHKGVRVNVGAARAQPFFYVAYRTLKKRMKSRITRNMRKAIKEGASS